MTNPQHHPPSPKKLSYLRSLADSTGQTFAYPSTDEQASIEITRLKRSKRTSRDDRRREVRAVRDDMATRRGDAAAVRADELGGYGSTAAWK